MDKKTIAVVAVVALIAVIAAVFLLMPAKDYNAQELADKFIKDYDGEFGEFEILDGGDETTAIMTYAATQKAWDGTDLGAERVMNIKIVHFDTKEEATEEFDNYVQIKEDPYLSKNGSKGMTMVTQTNKLGMADKHCTVLNSTDIVPAEGAEIKTVKASDYGADQIYVLYASYHQADNTKQQYSQFSMVLQDGKNLVVINQSSKAEFSMYVNTAIKDDSEAQDGEIYYTVEDFEKALIDFCKAF